MVAAHPESDAQAEHFIRAVAGDHAPDDILSVGDTTTLGGSYQGESRPFVLGRETLAADEIEYAQLERLLGGSITCAVELGAMCKSSVDYLVLGELAIELAARMRGLILLGDEVRAYPTLGTVAVITTAEGYRYSAVDSVALRDLLSRGISVFVK